MGIKVRLVRGADNLTAICEPSHNPIGLHGLLRGQLYFFTLLLASLGAILCFTAADPQTDLQTGFSWVEDFAIYKRLPSQCNDKINSERRFTPRGMESKRKFRNVSSSFA
jgi:hypothetical protein